MRKFAYPNRRLWLMAVLLITALACKDEENPTVGTDLRLETTPLGRVLTGDGGRTLYVFARDTDGKANCSGACTETWPVFYKEFLTVGAGLNAADFTILIRADGSKQTTYKGWPLYYYRNDTKAGDINGENVANLWTVARLNYTVMVASRQLVGLDGRNYTFDQKEGTGNSLYLTDNLGRTLYAFAPDKRNKNTFTTADLSNNSVWPIAEVSAINEIPSTLNKDDFGTTSAAGKAQLTYKGWPLYYFGGDQGQRGSTKGVSVPRPGVWPVVYKTTPEAPVN